MPPPLPKRRRRFKALLILLGVLLFLGLASTRALRSFKVPTNAMMPTIQGIQRNPDGSQKKPGDHLFVNQVAYFMADPKRGDIVVFRTRGIVHPAVKPDQYYIKRIVGLPRETISIRPPFVLVNGEPLTEPEIFARISGGEAGFQGYFYAQKGPAAFLTSEQSRLVLGEDEYLTLGDNSRRSLDGRYYGPIKRDAIVGKALSIYYPFDRMGPVK